MKSSPELMSELGWRPKGREFWRGDEEAGLQEKHSSMESRVEIQQRPDDVDQGEASWRPCMEAGSRRMIRNT